MSNDTQPLTGYQVPENAPYQAYDKPVEPAYLSKAFQEAEEAYGEEIRRAMKRFQAQRDFDPNKPPLVPEPKHKHGPFTFLMNQNHNALRGCQSCGSAWVGSMAGNEENLRWHPVYELEEEEE